MNRHDKMVARRALQEGAGFLAEDFGDIRAALQGKITIGDIRRVRFELAKISPGEAMGFVPYVADQIQNKLNSRMLREALLSSVNYASTKCVPVMRPHVDRFARHLVDPSARFPSDWYESPEYEQGWLMECEEHIAKAIEEMVTSCLPWPHHIMRAMGLDADKIIDIADEAAESIVKMGEWDQLNVDVSGHIAMNELDERQVIGKIVVDTLKLWKESLAKAQKNESVQLSEGFGGLRAAFAKRNPSLEDIKAALFEMRELFDEMGREAYADTIAPYVMSNLNKGVVESMLKPTFMNAADMAAWGVAEYEENFQEEFQREVMRNASLYAPYDEYGDATDDEEFDAEALTIQDMGDMSDEDAYENARKQVDEAMEGPEVHHIGYDYDEPKWLIEMLTDAAEEFCDEVIPPMLSARSVFDNISVSDNTRTTYKRRLAEVKPIATKAAEGFLKEFVSKNLSKLQYGFIMNPPSY